MTAQDELNETVIAQRGLVSYRWLARKVKCHVNTAKEELWQFYQQNIDELDASFVVTGLKKHTTNETPIDQTISSEGEQTKETEVRSVAFAKGSEVEQVKAQFDRVISIHVHSIGPKPRGTSDDDSDLSAAIDNDALLTYQLTKRLMLEELYQVGVLRNAAVDANTWAKIASSADLPQPPAPPAQATAQTAAQKSEPAEESKPPAKKTAGVMDAFKKAKPKESETSDKQKEQMENLQELFSDDEGDVKMEEAPPAADGKRKKKVSRKVTKKNAEGYLETQTVEEWVTDNEEPPKPKPKPKPAPAPAPAAKGKKKGNTGGQKSLTSFFQKK